MARPIRTEASLQRHILRIPFTRGHLWRNAVGSAWHGGHGRKRVLVPYGLGGKGGADIIGCVNGRFVALELKTDTGTVSAEQAAYLDTVRECGGYAAVVRPGNLDEILTELRGL